MFIVSTIEDKVRVHPQDLAKPTLEAVTAELERTYIDKVVPDLGLVVTLFDILDIQGGFVFPSDGAAHFDTKFRVVIFKPFVGEVIVGKLKSCDKCVSSPRPSSVLGHSVRQAAYLLLVLLARV